MRFTIIVGLSLLLSGWSLSPVSASPITPQTFYFVSEDKSTKDTSITIANLATMKARLLLTIAYQNTAMPNQLFSAHELEVFNSDIHKGFYTRSTPDTSGVFQQIQGTWLLDENRLLVETTNEVCQSPMLGCYGFYEFLTADITTGELTSIQKIEYHPQLAERWTDCGENPQVFISEVLPNPTQELFSFTLIPLPWRPCSGISQNSYAVIVNYADLHVSTRYIPSVSGMSWSPDGAYLSFYTVENCSPSCESSVQLLSSVSNAAPTVLYHGTLASDRALFTSWIDDRTLVYTWVVAPSIYTDGPTASMLYWHDVIDNSQGTEPFFLDLYTSAIFRLDRSESVSFVGSRYSNSDGFGFLANRNATVTTNFPPIHSTYYNSKYNTYMFVNLDIAENTVEVIDAHLNQTSYNLSSFLTNPSKEWIDFVAPGA